MKATIREVRPADLSSILDLDAECFPPNRLELEPAKPGEIERGVSESQILVAESAGKLVGFLQYGADSIGHLELISLAVSESARGQGLGGRLLNRFLELNPAKPGTIWCVTSPTNLAMRCLLERYGFSKVADIKDYFGPGKDRVRYSR